jgi:hypothetical protein
MYLRVLFCIINNFTIYYFIRHPAHSVSAFSPGLDPGAIRDQIIINIKNYNKEYFVFKLIPHQVRDDGCFKKRHYLAAFSKTR